MLLRMSRLIIAFFVLLPGCGDREASDGFDYSVEDWLAICSPFTSLDREKMLDFRDDHTVTLHKIARSRDLQAKGILETKNEIIEQGSWTADNTTGDVTVSVAGDRTSYTLVVPYNSQCVLGAGQVEAVNLRSSWYGTPDFGDNTQ